MSEQTTDELSDAEIASYAQDVAFQKAAREGMAALVGLPVRYAERRKGQGLDSPVKLLKVEGDMAWFIDDEEDTFGVSVDQLTVVRGHWDVPTIYRQIPESDRLPQWARDLAELYERVRRLREELSEQGLVAASRAIPAVEDAICREMMTRVVNSPIPF